MATDPILERQPWIFGGHFNDVDAQAAQLHGYDQQYLQLSRGPFEGRFRSFIFGDDLGIHLMNERCTPLVHARKSRCSVPRGADPHM